MKYLKILFLLSLICTLAHARGEVEFDQYYLQLFTGQHKISNYEGPIDALTRFNSENGQLVFLDEIYRDSFFQNELQAELFGLRDFWFNKLNDQSACPDHILSENLEYIRYLYRLTTISYLFESFKINNRVNSQLGGNKSMCSLSYDEIFGKCKPRSADMENFKLRLKGKFINEYSKVYYDSLFKSELNGWLTLFKRSNPETQEPTFARLHQWCKKKELNCQKLSLEDIKKTIVGFCDQDRKQIQLICNEYDELYGMSYVSQVSYLVKKSSAFNLINSGGMGENCLRRFEKTFKAKEFHNRDLVNLYSTIFKQLVKENSRFPQGELFLPGALKEFDNKGLSDFLTALKPPVEVVVVNKPKAKLLPIKKVEIHKVEVPVVVEKVPDIVITPEPIPEVYTSEFEKAVLELKEKNLEVRVINMEVFQYDFEFTTKMISELSIPLRKFQTRQALSDMKTLDNLGSKEVPLGLKFLKFLIDTDNHQGLFNVQSVFSDKFYVINDLENKKIPAYVQLKNDSSTNNHWQLSILRPRKNSEALVEKKDTKKED